MTPAPISQLMGELVVDLLETTGLIPEAKFEVVRERAKHLPVVQVLIDEGLASSEAIARHRRRPVRAPGGRARQHRHRPDGGRDRCRCTSLEQVNALPYAFEDDSLCVAISDPQNIHGIDSLRLASRHPIALRVAASEEIATELGRLARTAEAFGGTRSAFSDDVVELEVIDEGRPTTSRWTTASPTRRSSVSSTRSSSRRPRTVRATSTSSRRPTRSSCASGSTACCTRPSGSRSAAPIGVTTRLKVLAKLDIAERRKPQDGRISLSASAAGRMLDVRVATLPTVEGESVVMRLLDKSKKPPTIEEVGSSTRCRSS